MNSRPEAEDEVTQFTSSLAHKLRRLSPYQLAVAQSKLLQVMVEVEFTTPREPPNMNTHASASIQSIAFPQPISIQSPSSSEPSNDNQPPFVIEPLRLDNSLDS